MATLLGTVFSTDKKVVSQHDDQTLGSTIETLVISFDQEKFEEILSQVSNNPLSMHKHKKIFVAKTPFAISLKEASCEAKQTQGESNISSGEARHAQCEPKITSSEVSKTLLYSALVSGEAMVFNNPKSASCKGKRVSPSLCSLSFRRE